MALSYVKLFADASGAIDLLSDTEAGRLFKAVMHYINGIDDELPGQEKLVFTMLKAQFERDAEAYERFSQKQRENGKKGGRPRKPTAFQENPKNPTVFFETQKSQDKDKEVYTTTTSCFTDERPVMDPLVAYASNNLVTLSPINLQELLTYRDELTDEIIQHAIDEANGNGVRTYNYVRAILNRYVANGFKTLGEVKAYEEKRKRTNGRNDVPARYQIQENVPNEDEIWG